MMNKCWFDSCITRYIHSYVDLYKETQNPRLISLNKLNNSDRLVNWCALIWSIYSSNFICHAVDFNNQNCEEANFVRHSESSPYTNNININKRKTNTHTRTIVICQNGHVFVRNVKFNEFKPYKCSHIHSNDHRLKWK